jgi:hypothetical protein
MKPVAAHASHSDQSEMQRIRQKWTLDSKIQSKVCIEADKVFLR